MISPFIFYQLLLFVITTYKPQVNLANRLAGDLSPPITPSSLLLTHTAGDMEMAHSNKILDIIQCGTLAPSSHNTQCWKFEIKHNADGDDPALIIVRPDFSRRCPVVDPDDHHVFVTLGCAIENIVIAAQHYGFDPKVNTINVDDKLGETGITIQLFPAPSHGANGIEGGSSNDDKLYYKAIFERQCTRSEYDGTLLSSQEIERLKKAGTGNGVQLHIVTDKPDMDKILELILQANTIQMQDPAFRKELKSWIQFGPADTTSSKDGLAAACFGNPPIPRWLGNLIFPLVARVSTENAKIQKNVASSAGFAVFVSNQDHPAHWVEVGRCYERFALAATAMGIRHAFLNQPVEVPEFRSRLLAATAVAQGLEEKSRQDNNADQQRGAVPRPDLLIRFGRGPAMPRSLRRPLESVVVPAPTTGIKT